MEWVDLSRALPAGMKKRYPLCRAGLEKATRLIWYSSGGGCSMHRCDLADHFPGVALITPIA